MRVLVCGGRDYDDESVVFKTLDKIHAETPIFILIDGGATGADSLAADWARRREVWNLRCYASWKLEGRAAGPVRNKKMLDKSKPDLVVAFPGGNGTAHMVKIAKEAGVEVKEIL